MLWTHNYDLVQNYDGPAHQSVIEGAAIAATGELLSHDVLSLGPLPQNGPEVGQNAMTAAVAWTETDMRTQLDIVRYAFVNRSSHATMFEAELDAQHSVNVTDVVPLGTDFLVVWRGFTNTTIGQVAARAAIVRQNGTHTTIDLPPWALLRASANSDHWLIAGALGDSTGVQTLTIARDGTATAPILIAAGTTVTGLASDGDRFLLSMFMTSLLDRDGRLLTLPNDRNEDVDFTGGRYGAVEFFNDTLVLATYDADARKLTTTSIAPLVFNVDPAVSHIGPSFVVMRQSATGAFASIVASDGTLLAREQPVPRGVIAKTSSASATFIQIDTDAPPNGYTANALFVSDVSILTGGIRRSVRH